MATGAVKNYYIEDGLSHNEFNTPSALKARNGQIFMGGLNGVNAFFPAELDLKTTIQIHTLLSKYSLFDSKKDSLLFFNALLCYLKKLYCRLSVTSLHLHLALTSYLDPAKNQYAWRMDGLDDDWYYAGDQTRRLLSAPVLRAAILSAQKPPTLLATERETNFASYRRAAPLVQPLVGLAAVRARGGRRLSFTATSWAKMEHAENLRLQELDEFKSRFFTNITHEFRTPLTVILGTAEQLDDGRRTVDGRRLQGKLRLIRRNGENLLRLINQILDLAKLESNSLKMQLCARRRAALSALYRREPALLRQRPERTVAGGKHGSRKS